MANKIKYGDRELDMGDLTLEQAKTLMARHFPELADPEIKTEKKSDGTLYTFTKKAGRKG
jgi:PRTRC genetic system protein C